MENSQESTNLTLSAWRKSAKYFTVFALLFFFVLSGGDLILISASGLGQAGFAVFAIPYFSVIALVPAIIGLHCRARIYLICPSSERGHEGENFVVQGIFCGFLFLPLLGFGQNVFKYAFPVGINLSLIAIVAATIKSRSNKILFPKWVEYVSKVAIPIVVILLIGLGISVRNYYHYTDPSRAPFHFEVNEPWASY